MISRQFNTAKVLIPHQRPGSRLFRACSHVTISLLVLLCAWSSVIRVRAQGGLALAATNVFGGAGDQRALATTISGNALYLSGIVDANGGDALAARWTLPLTNNAAPVWNVTWPGLAGSDDFSGI